MVTVGFKPKRLSRLSRFTLAQLGMTLLFFRMFIGVIWQQIFMNAFGFDKVPIGIVVQLNDPAEHIIRPLVLGEYFFWVGPQRMQKSGNFTMMPGD